MLRVISVDRRAIVSLLALLVVAFGNANAHAQSSSDPFDGVAEFQAPGPGQLPLPAGKTQPQTYAPALPAATNGTIGPQGSDVILIRGAMVAGTEITSRPRPTFLEYIQRSPFMAWMVPITAFLLYLFVRRKKASMWETGGVAAMIATLSGGFWGFTLFH